MGADRATRAGAVDSSPEPSRGRIELGCSIFKTYALLSDPGLRAGESASVVRSPGRRLLSFFGRTWTAHHSSNAFDTGFPASPSSPQVGWPSSSASWGVQSAALALGPQGSLALTASTSSTVPGSGPPERPPFTHPILHYMEATAVSSATQRRNLLYPRPGYHGRG